MTGECVYLVTLLCSWLPWLWPRMYQNEVCSFVGKVRARTGQTQTHTQTERETERQRETWLDAVPVVFAAGKRQIFLWRRNVIVDMSKFGLIDYRARARTRVCVGVNSFVLSLSDETDLCHCLYEAIKHCKQLGALAVINADTHPSFVALVSLSSSLLFYL